MYYIIRKKGYTGDRLSWAADTAETYATEEQARMAIKSQAEEYGGELVEISPSEYRRIFEDCSGRRCRTEYKILSFPF